MIWHVEGHQSRPLETSSPSQAKWRSEFRKGLAVPVCCPHRLMHGHWKFLWQKSHLDHGSIRWFSTSDCWIVAGDNWSRQFLQSLRSSRSWSLKTGSSMALYTAVSPAAKQRRGRKVALADPPHSPEKDTGGRRSWWGWRKMLPKKYD